VHIRLDLGALVSTGGSAVAVSGRGICSLKRKRHQGLPAASPLELRARAERASARAERQVRDLRHKATRLLIDADKSMGRDAGHLFVGAGTTSA
jgi:hypothetical protein